MKNIHPHSEKSTNFLYEKKNASPNYLLDNFFLLRCESL